MDRRETLFSVIATLALGCLLASLLPGNGNARTHASSNESGTPCRAYTTDQSRVDLESFDSIWRTVRDHHWDPDLGGLDWDGVRCELRPQIEAAGSREEARQIMQRMLDSLGISHCQLIPEEVFELLGGAGGRGARDGWTGITVVVADDSVLVRKLEEGSAANVAGLKPGWEILEVGGIVMPERLEKAAALLGESPWLDAHLHEIVRSYLEGPVGEPVSLRLADPEGGLHDAELILDQKPGRKFEAGNLPGHYVSIEVTRPHEGVGYIAISQFTAPSYVMPRFNAAIQDLGDCRGIILDLRGNSGGMGAMVIGVARWFLAGEARDLGTTITRDTSLRFLVPPRPEAFPGGLAILIDGGSGSGSEVLAGGLQAIGRARVFGTRSMGAVLASTIIELPNGDCLQYAFADFVDPNGARLEGIGVRPDVEIRPSQAQLATGTDPVVEAASAWIL